MPKATIDDLVNIGVGYGGVPNTPDARERYKAVLRANSPATVAADKAKELRWLLRKQPVAAAAPRTAGQTFHATSPATVARLDRKDAVAASLEAQPTPQAPAAPAPGPTEYPSAWRQARRVAAAPAPALGPTEYPGAWKQARHVAAGIRVDRKAARTSTGRD